LELVIASNKVRKLTGSSERTARCKFTGNVNACIRRFGFIEQVKQRISLLGRILMALIHADDPAKRASGMLNCGTCRMAALQGKSFAPLITGWSVLRCAILSTSADLRKFDSLL
jgi:hypothetical protein